MRNKTHNLALFVGCLMLMLNAAHAFAQSEAKDFGWSLKRFETNRKPEKKDKKRKKEKDYIKSSEPVTPTDVAVNNQKSNAENTKTAADDEIIRVETNLVINDISVVDEKGTAVPNLKPEDFIVSEDGREQKVELFAYGENAKLPRSIVLIFFYASNTYNNDSDNSLEAAKYLVDKLAPQDKMAIVTTDIKLILPFTKDKNLLKKTLTDFSLKPQSNLGKYKEYGTLIAVLNELFDEKDVRPIVIFQTGGNEISGLKLDSDTQLVTEFSRKTFLKNHGGERGYGFSDVKESIIKSRATVYSIVPTMRIVGLPREEQLRRAKITVESWMRGAVGETSSSRIADAVKKYQSEQADGDISNQTAMIETAKLSGGYTEWIERPKDAVRAYTTVFGVINNRYTIGYYPTNQAKDGKLRRVKISVRQCPEYMVLGRESYLAPNEKK